MSKRTNDLLLDGIIQSIDKIFRYTEGMSFEEFSSNELKVDAVVRNFEIIGEAANRTTEELKKKHTHIPWKQIIGLRNRIIHEYFGVDYEIVWTVIQENLKELRTEIHAINKE